MQILDKTPLLLEIHGGSFRGGLGAMGSSLTGMLIGAVSGAKILPAATTYFNVQSQSYIGSIKSSLTNFYVYNKYGHLGITSKAEVVGAVGGGLIGSVLGSVVFGMIMV